MHKVVGPKINLVNIGWTKNTRKGGTCCAILKIHTCDVADHMADCSVERTENGRS